MNMARDGWVLILLVAMVVLLIASLIGAYQLFGYTLVAFLGVIAARGFVERDRVTWVPPIVATLVLLMAFAGIFRYERTPVHDAADTVLGFQPATAFLIYGIWIPAFFTLGLSFALVFDRLTDGTRGERP
jgi:hypothetical protein